LVFDMFPKFTDLIVFTILTSYLGGQYSSESNVIRRLYLSLGQSGGVPANGNFEVSVKIYGYDVTIRGAVVDGIPRIGTAFIK
ncbi:MAG TPA: hypothetical protein PKE07_00005, partial [Lacibacter sp.]|nr:hypothetical protein [Lacibacter sp.]HMO88321.1 hypothetical protein [Lacibacter sp.]